MEEAKLTISQAADEVGCHRNTISNYEKRGIIMSYRDINGYRRYPMAEIQKLKRLLNARWIEPMGKHT